MRQLMDTIQVMMCHHFTNNRKESSSLPAAAVVQPQFKLSASVSEEDPAQPLQQAPELALYMISSQLFNL
jgi:hypothetical protein